MKYIEKYKKGIILLVTFSLLTGMALVSFFAVKAMNDAADVSAKRAVGLLCREEAATISGEFRSVQNAIDLLSTNLGKRLDAAIGDESEMDLLMGELAMAASGAAVNLPSVSAVYLRMDAEAIGTGVGFLMLREEDGFTRSTLTDITRFHKDDVENVGWYYIPRETGKPTWMPPYVDYKQRILMTSYIVPLFYRGETIGVVGMDISLAYLHRLINDNNVYEGGYSYIVYNGEPLFDPVIRAGDHGWIVNEADCGDGFTIVENAPRSQINKDSEHLILTLIAAVVVITLCTALVAFSVTLNMSSVLSRTLSDAEEAQENAVKAAREASRAKSDFLSRMSHDIRTPMNAIVGMTSIAENHPDDNEKLLECIDRIGTAGNHLLTLVNDVLDISKIESGKMVLNPIRFSLTECVTGLLDITGQSARGKNIDLRSEIGGIPCDTILADRVRVNQVYLNLLSNAVKYTPEGGTVTVCLRQEFNAGTGMARVTFVVSDTGIGMSAKFMETMYDSFTRAGDSRLDTVQEAGLGLAIVKQMVDLMGGEILCNSREHAGTTFTVILDVPGIPEDNDGIQCPADSGTDILAGRRVLVAEDNDINWEVISELLTIFDMTCERACNGRECVECLEDAPPGAFDIVLMDVQMPVMNGREATRVIRAHERKDIAGIPVIALSADSYAEDIAGCMEAGMDSHVPKPVEIAKLTQVMRRILEENRK